MADVIRGRRWRRPHRHLTAVAGHHTLIRSRAGAAMFLAPGLALVPAFDLDLPTSPRALIRPGSGVVDMTGADVAVCDRDGRER